jgi:nucleoside-diphosphate-sugar epimerase
MKIAVTGAKGRVGQFVIKELLIKGYEVKAITHSKWDQCPVEQISLDILDYDNVYEALKDCNAVIHLAAIPSPGKDLDSSVFQINTIGTYNIVLASGLLGIKRVAMASSDCALGFTFAHNRPPVEYLPVDEEHPAWPDNGYGLSKITSERICSAMAQRFQGMVIGTLRISHVIEKEWALKYDYFKKWTMNPEAGPWNLWSYIDARDCAAAFRLAIEAEFSAHEVFCIAAPNTRMAIPSMDLIKMYFPETILKKDFNGYESLENSSKAERILGFKAQFLWNEEYGIKF